MLKESQVRSGDWNNNIYYMTVIHRGLGALNQMVRLINIHVQLIFMFVSSKSCSGIFPVRKTFLYKCQVFRGCLQLSMLGCSRANMEKSSICCFINVWPLPLVEPRRFECNLNYTKRVLGKRECPGLVMLVNKTRLRIAITLQKSGQSE